MRRNIYGLIAIFIALSGTAYAVQKAPKNSVVSSSIKNSQVKEVDLASGAVTGSKVADDSLTGAEIVESSLRGIGLSGPAGGSLTGSYPNPGLAANSVGAGQLSADSVTSVEVVGQSLTGLDIADTDSLGALEIDESGFAFTPGADVIGTLAAAQLATNSVGTNEILNGSVEESDLDTDAVSNAKVADEAVGGAELSAGAVDTVDLAPNAVTHAKMANNAIGSEEVAANSLELADLAFGIVDETTIDVAGSVPAGTCSAFLNNAIDVGVAPAGSETLVFNVRMASGAGNVGWTADGTTTTSPNEGRLRVCNNTGAGADPPSLLVSYLTIAA